MMLSDLRYRFRALLRRGELNAELDEELRDHVERETDKYVRAGMDAAEGRRRALIALGGMEQTHQRTRDSRGTRMVEQLRQDLRYGLRSLAKNRLFTVVFVLTLSLGIGSCTAIFSLMTAVMFPPLPYADVGRLVYISTPNRNMKQVPPEALIPDNADFADLKRENHSLTEMTQFTQRSFRLAGTGASLSGAAVDADFFTTLEARPELGRAIAAEDNQPANAGVVVISHSLWQQLFGADPSVLGKSLQLNGKAYRVIGVMPAAFHYPRKADLDDGDAHMDASDLWVPLALTPAERADRGFPEGNNYALGRLKDGVSASQAAEDMSTIMQSLDPLHTAPAFKTDWYAYVKPFRETLEGSARPLLLLLMGSVCFVLLIACGNAANLLLARSASRTHELGVRATLGAGRYRLMQQMLTESLLLGAGGGIAGIGVGWGFLRLLLMLDPGGIPRLHEASLEGRVLAFAVALTFVTSILTGSLPALSASRMNLIGFLKSGGQTGARGGGNRLRSTLIVGEVAIVVVLLAGAGLLVRSFLKLEETPVGFSLTTLSLKVDLPASYDNPARSHAFFETLLSQVGAMQGTVATGAIMGLPFGDFKGVNSLRIEGDSYREEQAVDDASATSGYFSAMGIPQIEGRSFTEEDVSEPPRVAIVNQAFARKYFAGGSAVGKWVSPVNPGDPAQAHPQDRRTIVGVVGDVRDWNIETPAEPQIFSPLRGTSSAYVVIRSTLPRKDIVQSATAILHRIDAGLAFSKVHTMREVVSETTARRRFQMVLLAIFAGMALLLALVGFYGLLTYAVMQRSAEMGIRIALGATRAHVVQLIVRQGLQLVSAGLVFGLIAALVSTRLLRSSLYEVSVLDPVTFVAVPAVFLIAALVACILPAWRAAASDPMVVLRCE